ncbi:hypothetical protein ACOSQ2_016908 [Xanthoceras sorbifolium]
MADQRTLFCTCGWNEHFTQQHLWHISDPSQEIEGMHIDLYICVLYNKINHGSWNWDKKSVMQGTMLFGELAAIWKRDFVATGWDMNYDASTYECPYLWPAYVSREKDACIPWWDIENVLIPCYISNFHWVLCKIVLRQKNICIYDLLSRGKDPKQRIKYIEPLTRFLPAMLRCRGFFDHTNIDP